MDSSLVRNYFYNILYTFVRIALPFILAPYTYAHVGPVSLGIYQFAGSIMNWFILFGILGINIYGNRQIARVRNDREELSRTFWEIFSVQVLDMLVAIAAFYLFLQATVTENLFYYQITGLTMIASMCDITWFFYGVEDFKNVTIRNIVIRCTGVALIFLLVKSSADLWLYILINVCTELAGQIVMFFQLPKFISFRKVSIHDAYRHHFHATFRLFVPTIATSVYTMLDTTMIGYLYSEEHVQFYQSAMNPIRTILTFITSIGSVVLPRVSNLYYSQKDGKEKAQALVNTTMKIAMFLALPICLGVFAISQHFMTWYIPGYPILGELMMLGCPIIVLISMSNVIGTQYMIPTGLDKEYTRAVITGSAVNLVCNSLLIPKFGAIGAVIGSVAAETAVTITEAYMIRGRVHFGFRNRSYRIYIFGAALMFAAVYSSNYYLRVNAGSTLLQILIGILIYYLVLRVAKEDLCMRILSGLRNHIVHNRQK